MGKLFQAFLGRLHKCALDEDDRREREVKVKDKRKGASSKSTVVKGSSSTLVDGAASEGTILVRILAQMMGMLDVAHDAHCELLEGILCSLLDHIGSSLSLLVFAGPKSRGGHGSGILPPKGLLDLAHIDIEVALRTAKIEGPYLICVLRRFREFLRTNTRLMSQKSIAMFALDKTSGKSGKEIQQMIERTLQNTLLRAVFDDDDDTFYNSLRREEEHDEAGADMTKIMNEIKQDEGSAEWFIGEVWEHLGWGILSSKKRLEQLDLV